MIHELAIMIEIEWKGIPTYNKENKKFQKQKMD